MNSDKQMGNAISDILDACAQYCSAYEARFESPVGDDGVLGDGMTNILHGINCLLNGPLGAHDGATLSKKLHRLAADVNLVDLNGEIR